MVVIGYRGWGYCLWDGESLDRIKRLSEYLSLPMQEKMAGTLDSTVFLHYSLVIKSVGMICSKKIIQFLFIIPLLSLPLLPHIVKHSTA